MTRPTLDSSPQNAIRLGECSRRRARASWRLAVCASLAAVLLACGGGDGGGSDGGDGAGSETPLATEPIDLPAGLTVAQLAWQPSAGKVASYMVFLSRNDGSFDFDQTVTEPAASVTGAPGDEIRIVVMAVAEDGHFSEASPASVPIRFHPAAGEQVVDNGPTSPPPSGGGTDSGGDASADPDPDLAPDSPVVEDPAPPVDDLADAGTPPPVEAGTPGLEDGETADETIDPRVLTPALRRSLLLANVRQPLSGLAEGASAWLQSQLAGEVASDAALIATAKRSVDSLRDLVWQDSTGQLFLADAEQFAEAEEPGATLVAAIQLFEGERFVDLVDLDGDGAREWIVEDLSTGAVWLRSDDGTADRAARTADQPETARLLGSGDFDGDGQPELLWQDADRTLALARPTSAAPLLGSGTVPPTGSQIVAFADLTGDGLDDLIARSEDGFIALGLASVDPASGAVAIEWSEGHAEADASSELVATLDLDADGRAELAWLVGETVEIRGLGETTPRVFEF